MLISLIYVSSASRMMSNEELLAILHSSHRNNAEKNVTGMLLYKGGNFLQVLEGEEEDVFAIYKKIEQDTRHSGLVVISQDPIEERSFADWRMAFVNLDDDAIKNEPAFSEFLNDEFTDLKFRETPHLAFRMLLHFKENIR